MTLTHEALQQILAGERPEGLKIFAGTGHRPDKLGGYNVGTIDRITGLCWSFLRDHPCHVVISGMAQGFDQALATAAFQHGIPFIAAVPFPHQAYAWPKGAQLAYSNLLTQARHIAIIDQDHDLFGTAEIAQAFKKRNRWMVDRATHIVSLWDGSGGGTKHCVEYGEHKRRKFYSLWDTWTKGLTDTGDWERVA